jgi:cytochrome c oxidase subunit 3
LFLLTELLLFGGLFLVYSVYRSAFAADFHYAAATLDSTLGTVNTVVLLTSSLSVALAVWSVANGRRRGAALLLGLTIALALVFLVIKYFEWSAKIDHELFPNSTTMLRHTAGENLFYGLYYTMTGLHGLHVLVGIAVLAVMLVLVWRRPRRVFEVHGLDSARLQLVADTAAPRWTHPATDVVRSVRVEVTYAESPALGEVLLGRVENAALYWHLVDVVWIFLFPLFYLIS